MARQGARQGVWLQDLTWPEAQDLFQAGAVVLVPVGAIAKEHGHHLPLKTDYLLAVGLAERVRSKLPVVVAPVITFGYYPAFVDYPGSQHLSSETFVALTKEILLKLIKDGAKHIAVLNTGISTEGPLRIALRDIYTETGFQIGIAGIQSLGRKAKGHLEQKLGGHADEAETSIILALEPSEVRMDRAVTDYGHAESLPEDVFHKPVQFSADPNSGLGYSKTGVRGDPTLATAERGEALLDEMVEDLVDGLRTMFPRAFDP